MKYHCLFACVCMLLSACSKKTESHPIVPNVVVTTVGAPEVSPLQTKLDVQVKRDAQGKDGVYAQITIHNMSDTISYLDPWYIEPPLQANAAFHIEDENQKEISWKLRMVKRMATPDSELIKIGAHANKTVELRLDDAYAFLPGSHQYTVFYSAYHRQPAKIDKLLLAKSNMVSFTYTAVEEKPQTGLHLGIEVDQEKQTIVAKIKNTSSQILKWDAAKAELAVVDEKQQVVARKKMSVPQSPALFTLQLGQEMNVPFLQIENAYDWLAGTHLYTFCYKIPVEPSKQLLLSNEVVVTYLK